MKNYSFTIKDYLTNEATKDSDGKELIFEDYKSAQDAADKLSNNRLSVFPVTDKNLGGLEIYELLKEMGLYEEVFKSEEEVAIFIEDGDWKHDHDYCDFIMGAIGYQRTSEDIVDEHGDDYYSSYHYYKYVR